MPDKTKRNIGEEMKAFRELKSLSQADMMKIVGVSSQQVYSNIENGKTKKVDGEIYRRFDELRAGITNNIVKLTTNDNNGGKQIPVTESPKEDIKLSKMVNTTHNLSEANKALSLTVYELAMQSRRQISVGLESQPVQAQTFSSAFDNLIRIGVLEGRWSAEEGRAKLSSLIPGMRPEKKE